MIRHIVSLFRDRGPRQEASVALACIATLADMGTLPWTSGVCQDRRAREKTHVVIGIWLCPFGDNERPESARLNNSVSAVSNDLQSEGFGLLVLNAIDATRFVVAVPNGTDSEESWKFFVTTGCHKTARPGGWCQLGLRIDRIMDPAGDQYRECRDHIAELGHVTLVGADA